MFVAGQKLHASDLNSPIAMLRQLVAQSLPNNAFTPLTFTGEDLDTDSGHSTSVNPSRYTATRTGRHLFMGGSSTVPNATGARGTTWLKNGANLPRAQCLVANAGAATSTMTVARTVIVDLVIGDYVELCGYQMSGGLLSTTVTFTEESYMDIYYLN